MTRLWTLQSLALVVLGGTGWIIWAIKNRNTSASDEGVTPENKKNVIWWSLLFCCATAAVGGVSYIFQLESAKNLPATVVYPFLTGGSIIFTAISGLLFFKEKISKKVFVGIVLCFIGTLMFL